MRRAKAKARAVADRARLAQEGQSAAAARAGEALAAAVNRHAHAMRDLAHAEETAEDAAGAEARLARQALGLAEQEAAGPARLAALRADATQTARSPSKRRKPPPRRPASERRSWQPRRGQGRAP